MKKLTPEEYQTQLQEYVKMYFQQHPATKLIVVAGSIGKTYTKIAIARMLAQRYRVRLYHGNRGTNFTAPLEILGIDYPGDIDDQKARETVLAAAQQRIQQPSDADVIILELNTAAPGLMAQYAQYIVPDLAVITAVSESNIEAFGTVDAIAQEQLLAASISRMALINRDDIDGEFAKYLTTPMVNTFGTDASAEYRFAEKEFSIERGFEGDFVAIDLNRATPVPVTIHAYDEFALRQAVAACAVGVKFGLTGEDIARGAASIRPLEGRMKPLRGREGAVILDNTAANSPLGSRTALDALYRLDRPQRIAVFGGMKHLGPLAEQAHRELGDLCTIDMLDWVVTVGPEATQWLAPAARAHGCQVKECQTPYEAGAFVRKVQLTNAAILFDGPEDDVYLEEAVKIVLHNAEDGVELIRQDEASMARKAERYSAFS